MAKFENLIELNSQNYVPGIKYVKDGINLCRLPSGLICVGCCGFDFAKDLSDKESFIKAMKKSTDEYKNYKNPLDFKNRYESHDMHKCGLCKHLVISGEKNNHLQITCPLHPTLNNGEDFRIGECDPKFMCNTQSMFLKEWGPKTKELFLKFLEEEKLDWFEYSKKMYHNKLSKKFMKSHKVVNYLE